jgi:hypothetical protein
MGDDPAVPSSPGVRDAGRGNYLAGGLARRFAATLPPMAPALYKAWPRIPFINGKSSHAGIR